MITRLEAVNSILSAIGQLPVNSLDSIEEYTEAADALTMLNHFSKGVQMRGFWFNREVDFPLTPNNQGEIQLPNNILSVDISDPFVVQRGKRLYDSGKHSYSFERPVKANLILELPFEELPPVAQAYILIKAIRKFIQDKLQGADSLDRYSQEDEVKAYMALHREAIKKEAVSILRGDPWYPAYHRNSPLWR